LQYDDDDDDEQMQTLAQFEMDPTQPGRALPSAVIKVSSEFVCFGFFRCFGVLFCEWSCDRYRLRSSIVVSSTVGRRQPTARLVKSAKKKTTTTITRLLINDILRWPQ
jgi:hypothetical protein